MNNMSGIQSIIHMLNFENEKGKQLWFKRSGTSNFDHKIKWFIHLLSIIQQEHLLIISKLLTIAHHHFNNTRFQRVSNEKKVRKFDWILFISIKNIFSLSTFPSIVLHNSFYFLCSINIQYEFEAFSLKMSKYFFFIFQEGKAKHL